MKKFYKTNIDCFILWCTGKASLPKGDPWSILFSRSDTTQSSLYFYARISQEGLKSQLFCVFEKSCPKCIIIVGYVTLHHMSKLQCTSATVYILKRCCITSVDAKAVQKTTGQDFSCCFWHWSNSSACLHESKSLLCYSKGLLNEGPANEIEQNLKSRNSEWNFAITKMFLMYMYKQLW